VSTQFIEGDFVVVQLTPETKRSHPVSNVGIVMSYKIEENGWQIQCIRRVSKTSNNQFSFPENDDMAVYTTVDIVARLSLPKIVGTRNVFHFRAVELYSYVHSLR
jgi:hypothetical protein